MPVTPLHESLAIRAEDIRPSGSLILLEANESETKIGSLWIPTASHGEVYPTSGWVYATGPKCTSHIKRGDFVLVEEEGIQIDTTYYDIFEVTLRHEEGIIEKILVDVDVWPVIQEMVERYRAGGPDNKLTLEDKGPKGGSVQFACHNVVSYQFGNLANPNYDLSYIPTYMLSILNEDGRLAPFYLIEERRILATVTWDD